MSDEKPRYVGIIIPPWKTASGEPELAEVRIDTEGAAERLAEVCEWTVDEAARYLEELAQGQAEYDAAVKYGDIGHA